MTIAQTKKAKSQAKVPKAKSQKLANAQGKPLNLSARSLWPKTSELVSLEFSLQPHSDCELYAQYTIGLHAWFLQQIQSFDPDLSAYLHNGQSEKAFSISGLNGQFVGHRQTLKLQASQTYTWRVNALSKQVAQGLSIWLRQQPDTVELNNAPLAIASIHLAQDPTTYTKLLNAAKADSGSVSLSFVSPTSFRRKGQHLPLPLPTNVFHSYLRRWNHFARKAVDQDSFLDWIDNKVIIQQHQLSSIKVVAGKQGSVTGFTGAITYKLDRSAADNPDFQTLFYALVRLAPFCGTGHKTTFGLGETHLGWQADQQSAPVPTLQQILAERIEALTELFLSQRKRQGGNRAKDTAQKWATILARREQGDRLDAIAQDMNIPYETVKTYSKLARKAAAKKE
ncbi:CRISPR-associated endoribonuclease Cas6 [cf. Phormidesmis sp. LEGE 11477]|uniref:CRISPR-associated endoribonuclease Cas6 n=1 Tax=cf. Phormidesmis sp. LEGE 11477 TaxID=1828680 RepID=UPI00187FFA7D|nr:CRISPR-associated endoribonuclease Cas6 [cf. Phormidesmis sp. LEGE 11477]MBE9059751.1 CRISPR-associated endoribonuclease Cas6 [cf. Phormidesmis sp. LEGE 11477]